MVSPKDVTDTLDDAQLWGINHKALEGELRRRFRIGDDEARAAVENAVSAGVIVIDRLGQVQRP
jgi:hypothetical protein